MQHRKFQFSQKQISISFLLIFSIVFSGCSGTNKTAAPEKIAQTQNPNPSVGTSNTSTTTTANAGSVAMYREINEQKDSRSSGERYAQINENPFLETARSAFHFFD